MLSKVRRYINTETSIKLYKSMIMPIMDYDDIVYSGASENLLDKLQKIQNRALRICLNVHYYLPVINLHQESNIPKLIARCIAHLNNYMFLRKSDPEIVVQRNIRTRKFEAAVLETVRPNIEKYKMGTIYRGILQWNALDAIPRNTEDYLSFKDVQKKRMLDSLIIYILSFDDLWALGHLSKSHMLNQSKYCLFL